MIQSLSFSLNTGYFQRVRDRFSSTVRHPISFTIVPSAVLSFAPWLELHHIVFLGHQDTKTEEDKPEYSNRNIRNKNDRKLDPNRRSKGLYAIDFTPIDQKNPKTILKLLMGRKVPAEIRIRFLKDGFNSVKEFQEIKDTWACMNYDDYNPMQSVEVSESALNCVTEPELQQVKKAIQRIQSQWDTDMHFYTHNCRHFSGFVKKFLAAEEVCVIY